MIFVHALGTAQIDAGTARVTPTSVRRFALLLHLAAEAGRRVSRSTLHELICPDQSEKNARHTLRELLYKLRQAGVQIISDTDGVEFPAHVVQTDYSSLAVGERLTSRQLQAIKGGLLPGYAPTHSEAFTEWLDAYRARISFDVCGATIRELTAAKAVADWPTVASAARACLAVDPLNEEATLTLAEVLALSGSKIQATKLLDGYSREVGAVSGLSVPVALLKRRIGEHGPTPYEGTSELPFSGRAEEMAYLIDRFARARTGVSQSVIVAGEPGIGKSRLASELGTFAVLKGASVHTARVQPHDAYRPLSAVSDLLPSLLDARGALGCAPETLARLRRIQQGVAQPSSNYRRPSGEAFHEVIHAITELIDAVSAESPLVLIVDDAHWLDRTSSILLRDIASVRTQRRVFIVLTSRPEGRLTSVFRDSDSSSTLGLRGLDDTTTEELVRAKLRESGKEDAEAIQWICGAANGNPLFLTMLASHFAATGARFEAPPTLLNLLLSRVRRLSPTARHLLVLSCLLSRHCSLEHLSEASQLGGLALMSSLAELEAAHLIRLRPGESRAPHALVIDAALNDAADIVVATAHRKIAGLLEAKIRSSGRAALWDAAEHWVAAGEREKGITLMCRCAADSDEIGRPREAAELYQRASYLAQTGKRLPILIEAMRSAVKATEHDLILRIGDQLDSEGWKPTHDEIEVALLGAAAVWRDDADVGEHLVHCLEHPESSAEHKRDAALALLRLAYGDRDTSLRERALTILRPILEQEGTTTSWGLRANLIYHVFFGDISDCPRLVADAARACSSLAAHASAEIRALAGIALLHAGEIDAAFQSWERAYDDARDSGLTRRQFDIAHMATTTAMDAGLDSLAKTWDTRVQSVLVAYPEFNESVYRLSHDSDLAAANQNLQKLKVCARSARRLFGVHTTIRVKRWLRAVEMQVMLLEGERLNGNAISELVAHHQTFSEGDVSDMEVATAIRVALANRDHAAARSIVRKYLQETRRNAAPFWSSLAAAIRAAGLSDEAATLMSERRSQALSATTTSARPQPTLHAERSSSQASRVTFAGSGRR